MDAAVGSMVLPDGVVEEFVLEVGVICVDEVVVSDVCVVVVEFEVVDFDARLAPRAQSPTMITSRTAAILPIISPVRLFRGSVVGGIGKDCT